MTMMEQQQQQQNGRGQTERAAPTKNARISEYHEGRNMCSLGGTFIAGQYIYIPSNVQSFMTISFQCRGERKTGKIKNKAEQNVNLANCW